MNTNKYRNDIKLLMAILIIRDNDDIELIEYYLDLLPIQILAYLNMLTRNGYIKYVNRKMRYVITKKSKILLVENNLKDTSLDELLKDKIEFYDENFYQTYCRYHSKLL